MRVLSTLFLALLTTSSLAEEFAGTVIKVHDGDTAHVKKANGDVIKVRFLLVDTPEIDQPHGIEARDFVANKILGEQVTVETDSVDVHGRALGEITFNGENINESVIEEGHGWWFYHYNSDVLIGQLEIAARSAKKGLWAAENPIYPRNWRDGARVDGGGSDGGSDGTTPPSIDTDVFIMGAMPNPREVDAGNESVVIANRDNADASVVGWKLEDDDGGSFALTGSVPAGGALTIRLNDSLQLGNGGDTIILKDAAGAEVHRISYGSVGAGQFVIAE